MYFFSYLEPVCWSMSSSNCCFLTCIQIFQEAGQVVWYSHLLKNFPQFAVINTKFTVSTNNFPPMALLAVCTENVTVRNTTLQPSPSSIAFFPNTKQFWLSA